MDWLPNFNQSNIVIALRAALAAAAILYNARTAPLRAMIRAAENRPSGVKAGGLQARDQADDAAKIVFREKAAPATVVGAIEGVCRDMLKSADVVPNLLLLFPPAPAATIPAAKRE